MQKAACRRSFMLNRNVAHISHILMIPHSIPMEQSRACSRPACSESQV